MLHALYHWAGLDDGSGAWYLWWSGFCGDLVFLGAFFGLFRHFNCHARRCPRLGLHEVPGTEYKTCRRHHPVLANRRPSVKAQTIADAHQSAQTSDS